MILLSKTSNCGHIKIESELISDFILNPGNYTQFQISGTMNCCTDETEVQSITGNDLATNQWTLNFPVDDTAVIKEIIFQNINTQQSWNILDPTTYNVVDYMCSTGDITLLYPIIQTWFTNNFATTVTQGYTYDAIEDICTYTIEDLPVNIRPVKMIVTVNGIDTEVYFGHFPIDNVFFSGTDIYIDPRFFGLTNFQDAVYSFTIRYASNGNIITESTCFFFDCETACKVSARVTELMNCNKVATNIFLLHYTLTEGSNCGCNCDELCEIFTKLCQELGGSDSCSNCGC